MARRLVSVDETTLLLPPDVEAALKADLAAEFETSVTTAVNAADTAESAASAAAAAAATATAPTDAMIAGRIEDEESLTRAALNDVVDNEMTGVGSVAATPDTLARRNASGQLPVATPTSGSHAVNVTYLDSVLDEFQPESMIADELAAVNTSALVIVAAGDSTANGGHVSEASLRWVNRLAARIQAAHPKYSGSDPAVKTLAEAVSSPPSGAGVHMVNAGVGSTYASNYLTSTTGPQVAALNPDLVIHMVGVNDFYYDVAVSTYKTNLINRIAQLDTDASTPPKHLLVHVHRAFSAGITDGTAHEWQEYGAAMAEIAAAQSNVEYLDLDVWFRMTGVLGTSDPAGMIVADQVHMSIPGHAMTADAIGDFLKIQRFPAPQDTGWVDIVSFGTGWGVTGGYTPQVRRVGNLVQMRGALARSGTTGAVNSMAVVPDGFWPSNNTFLPTVVSNGGTVLQPFIGTTGLIQVASGYVAGASLASGAVVPLVGSWYVN